MTSPGPTGGPRFQVWIDPPTGWVPVPRPGSDPASWARETGALLAAAGDTDVATVDQFVAELTDRAADCQSRSWIHALLLISSPADPVAAVAELQRLAPAAAEEEFSLEVFAAELSKRRRSATHAPEVTRCVLPAGPAVRCLRTTRAPRRGLTRPVWGQLVHGIFPPTLVREGLVLVTTWQDRDRGDALAAQADALAAQISIDLG